MNTLSRFTGVLAYLAALGAVLSFHACVLHLDETSEGTAPARVSTREA